MRACCLLGVLVCVCVPLFASGALHEVPTHLACASTPGHYPRTECTQGWRSGRWWTAFEQTLHSARHSRVSVLVRAHCVLLTHLSDGMLLRVVTYTAQCVRVVCSVSLCVCVYPFCVWGVARGPHALACASTPSLRERPRCNACLTFGIHTPPTTGRAASCSPLACKGTKVASARCVKPCFADLLGNVFETLGSVKHQCPRWFHLVAPHHPCGLYSRVILKSPEASRLPVQAPPRLKTPVSPSPSRMGGKARASTSRVDEPELIEIEPYRSLIFCSE